MKNADSLNLIALLLINFYVSVFFSLLCKKLVEFMLVINKRYKNENNLFEDP